MKENKLAIYIKNDLSEGLKEFKNDFIGSEIILENIKQFNPINFKLLEKKCQKLNIKFKLNLKNKSLFASFITSIPV